MPPTSDARWFTDEVQPNEFKLRSWLRAKFPSLAVGGDVADLERHSLSDQSPQAAATACRPVELQILRDAIEALPRRCRQVFTLRKLYGLSHREIAVRLGLSGKTVEEQVNLATRRCAVYLRQRGLR